VKEQEIDTELVFWV